MDLQAYAKAPGITPDSRVWSGCWGCNCLTCCLASVQGRVACHPPTRHPLQSRSTHPLCCKHHPRALASPPAPVCLFFCVRVLFTSCRPRSASPPRDLSDAVWCLLNHFFKKVVSTFWSSILATDPSPLSHPTSAPASFDYPRRKKKISIFILIKVKSMRVFSFYERTFTKRCNKDFMSCVITHAICRFVWHYYLCAFAKSTNILQRICIKLTFIYMSVWHTSECLKCISLPFF